MKPLPLDELPQYSEWATYLLDPTGDPPGDPTAYTGTEFYDEIFGYILEDYRESPVSREEFRLRTRSKGRSEPSVISIDEELFLAETDELLTRERTVLREALEPVLTGTETVFDLGCGWGSTLGVIADSVPDVEIVGGEYTESGVELARELYDEEDRISVEQFDFLGNWDLLDTVDGDRVVLTKQAVTALPESESVVERLNTLAADGAVTAGVHLEQVSPHPETVLGLLRTRYARERGFSTDLRNNLADASALRVTDVTYDAVGANPLHPLTVVRWTSI